MEAALRKGYSTFDCDAHVSEVPEIWDHLSRAERRRVAPCYRAEGDVLVINDRIRVPGTWAYGRGGDTDGWHGDGRRVPNRTACVGPGMDKALVRKLFSMQLSDAQCDEVDRLSARDPHARLREMDAQGIDQVMLIPLHLLASFLLVEDPEAAALVARAYNDWVHQWCSADRERLYAAAVLPLQDPAASARELERVARRGFRMAMVRPVEIAGRYPTDPFFDPMWRAFAETGLVAGVHTLGSGDTPWGALLERAANPAQMPGPAPSRCLGFVHEATIWVTAALLSGLLERNVGLKMAVMESNASWLPHVLERCDVLAERERVRLPVPLRARPSETFRRSSFISFEGDEDAVFEQHVWFREIAIWASDLPHIDGADAWSAIGRMRGRGVPESAQAALMGSNARRMYGIDAALVTRVQPPPPEHPDWFPSRAALEREYASRRSLAGSET
jgi:predicted TIM-barrel fold metal-dependent hydrolase